jgi:hypothetical protein
MITMIYLFFCFFRNDFRELIFPNNDVYGVFFL